ncbi:NAC domain-containing protein [Artemisia annua]|uniref:NAC domain-containing protein n=1 Tax=Artemisia annua TaxID=35608 RepID=A0A2U1QAC1_ARTAN|nr:NAC domain-containing protein [Artemisia annua]
MNPETNENNIMDANEHADNIDNHDNNQRKRKALETLNDSVNQNHQAQVQLQYAPEIGHIQAQQQLASTSYNNGHCQCGMVAMNDAIDSLYLDSLPIGYRFEPTDLELIRHYLLKKIRNENLPKNKISTVKIYEDHPKDIVGNYPQAKEGEWYFFTSRDRKYPNGKRPNRRAGLGYWKATGPDKVIRHKGMKIGGKKSLVYYEGHSPDGTKTNWMMHEYVVEGYERKRAAGNKDMMLNDYVLCKIYNKHGRGKEIKEEDDSDENLGDGLNRNLTAKLPVENGVTEAHQHAPDTNPAKFHVENNMGVQHSSHNSNHTINQVEHNLQNLYPNQHMNPSVENGEKGVQRQFVVPDQRASSHLDAHPTNFQVANNMPVQHWNHASHQVETNLTTMDTNQRMNPGVENRVKEVNRHITVPDQHMRVVSNQVQYSNQNTNRATHHVVNNFPTIDSHQHMNPNVGNGTEKVQRQVRVPDQQHRSITHLDGNPIIFNHVANYNRIVYNQNMGLPNSHVPTNMRPPRPVQMINSPRMKSQMVNHSHQIGFNQHKQLLSNCSPNVPPSWSPHPPPAHNVHVKPEIHGFVAPPQVQAAPTAFQEGNDSDEPVDVNTFVESMWNKDANDVLLTFDEDFQFDTDESGKHEAPKDEDKKN